MLLSVSTALSVMTESVSAIGNISGLLAGLNPDIATIADLSADEHIKSGTVWDHEGMHILLYEWHAMDSTGRVIEDENSVPLDLYIKKDGDDYIYDNDTAGGTKPEEYIEKMAIEGGKLKVTITPRQNSYTDTESQKEITEEFEGYSVSAGHSAVEVEGDTLTITYDENVHLVKVHVFYKNSGAMVAGIQDETVFGGTDSNMDDKGAEYDTGTVFVKNGASGEPVKPLEFAKNKNDPTKNAHDESELKDTDIVGSAEGQFTKIKYYDNTGGLHTDKTATAVGTDGRTFNLSLESWFVGKNIADVGLVLDASGSMAFTSDTMDKVHVDEKLYSDSTYNHKKIDDDDEGKRLPSEKIVHDSNDPENVYKFPEEAFLSDDLVNNILYPTKTDNSKLGYSDYTYYIFDSRSSTNEYVPIGYYDGTSEMKTLTPNVTGPVTEGDKSFPHIKDIIGYYSFSNNLSGEAVGSPRTWGLNAVDDGYARVVERQSESSISFTLGEEANKKDTIYDFAGESLASGKKSGFNVSYAGTNDSTQKYNSVGLYLDAVPTSDDFTLSFAIQSFPTREKDKDNESSSAKSDEILYIGGLEASGPGDYIRMCRDGGTNHNHLRIYQGSAKLYDGYNVYSEQIQKKFVVYTLVFEHIEDNKYNLTTYLNGVADTAGKKQITLNGKNIIFNGLKDEYNGYDIWVDDIYVFNAALKDDEVDALYTIVSKPVHSTKVVGDITWIATTEGKTLYYTDFAKFSKEDYEAGAAAKGWYYINSSGKWYNEIVQVDTAKDYRNLQAAKGDAAHYYSAYQGTDEDPDEPHTIDEVQKALEAEKAAGTESESDYKYYKYKPNGVSPLKFFIDKDDNLCCFYSNGNDIEKCGWSYVYKKKDSARIKAENLQHALGMFISRLDEASPDSKISAVRFSTDEIKPADYKQLVMLKWTKEANKSMPMFNFNHGSDVDADDLGGDEYNYVLTGSTSTVTGLKSFVENLKDEVADDGAKKYLIIFTDGKDTDLGDALNGKTIYNTVLNDAIEESEAYKIAKQLRDDYGYTIFSVMLAGGSVEDTVEDFDDYDIALRFLASLTGETDKDGQEVWKSGTKKAINPDSPNESDTYSQVYASHDSAGLAKIFSEEIVGRIADSLENYTVQDYIDPRFNLVDADGKVWHLNNNGAVVVTSEDPKTSEVTTKEYTISEAAAEPKSGEAIEEKETYKYLPIVLSHSMLLQEEGYRADLHYDKTKNMYYLVWKDQIIPGCNEEADQLPVWNAEIKIQAKDDFIGGNAVMSNGNAGAENYVYQEDDKDGKSSGTTDAGDNRKDDPENLPSKGFPRTTVNVAVPELEIKGGNQLIFLGEGLTPDGVAEKLGDTIYDYFVATKDDESHWYWEYLRRYAEYNHTTLNDFLDEIVEAAGKDTKYVDFPYFYIPDETNSNQTGSTTKHEKDRLGTLRFEWTEVSAPKGGESFTKYPEGGIAKDLAKRSSTLEVSYYPITAGGTGLPDGAENDGNGETVNNRETSNNDIHDETTIYGWDSSYKPAAGTEQTFSADKLSDSGDYVTEITGGDIIFKMIVPAKVVEYMAEHYADENLTYTAELKHNEETVGTFTTTLPAQEKDGVYEEETVRAYLHVTNTEVYNYVTEYGLPLGTYTIVESSKSELKGIKFGSIEIKDPVIGDYDTYTHSPYTPDLKTAAEYISDTAAVHTIGDFLANISAGTIEIGVSRAGGDYRDARYGLGQISVDLDVGSLSIEKALEESPASVDETYEFTITQTGGEYVNGEYSGTISKADGTDSRNTTVTFDAANHSATVSLKKGEKLTINDLPAGAAFKVTESDGLVYKYTTTYSPDSGDGSGAAQTIAKDSTAEVKVTNTVKTGDLSISKTVVGDDPRPDKKDKSFNFEITLTPKDGMTLENSYNYTNGKSTGTVAFSATSGGKTYTGTVALKGGETVTITGLPEGVTCEVVETDADTDAYTTTSTSPDSKEIAEGKTVEFSFTNTYKSVEATIEGSKAFSGCDYEGSEEFTFTLAAKTGDFTPMPKSGNTATVNGKGEFSFGPIEFPATEGTYEYTVTETKGTNTDLFDYDETTYNVTVTVAKNSEGEYAASVTYHDKSGEEAEKLVITNEYHPAEVKVQFTGTKTLIGRDMQEGETFSFTLNRGEGGDTEGDNLPADGLTAVFNAGDKSFTFPEITFSKTGTYIYTISEVEPTEGKLPGVTYDSKKYTVTVVVTDNNGVLEAEVTGDVTKPKSGDTVTVDGIDFTNEYNPKAISDRFTIEKILEGGSMETGRTFTFGIAFKSAVDGGTDRKDVAPHNSGNSVTIALDKAAEKGTGDAVEFTFTKPGVYTYTVTEKSYSPAVSVDGASLTKSTEEYEVTFTVTDNPKTGALEVTKTVTKGTSVYADDNLAFTNTYTPAPAEWSLPVKKSITGSATAKDYTFSFTLSGDSLTDDMIKTITVPAGETEKEASFDPVKFDKPGTYNFTVSETSGTDNGFTYDTNDVTVTVVVENVDGKLVANATYTKAGMSASAVEFRNKYETTPTTVTIPVKKTIEGTTATSSEFTFTLSGESLTEEMTKTITVPAGKNGPGETSFGPITLAEAKTYEFTVKETVGSLPGFTYDEKDVTVEIKVEDKGGELEVTNYTVKKKGNGNSSSTESCPDVEFTNIYKTVTATIEGKKEVTGNEYNGSDEFTFTLEAKDGAPMPDNNNTATATGASVFKFGNITLPAADGTYHYTVTETAGSKTGLFDYDETTYNVTVTVAKNSEGEYAASVTYHDKSGEEAEKLVITNVYHPTPVKVQFTGTKALTGRDMTAADSFTFKLVKTGSQEGDNLPADGLTAEFKAGDESFNFDEITFSKAGKYTYTISEVEPTEGKLPGVKYDETTYTVTVNVTDEGGILKAAVSGIGTGTEGTGTVTVSGLAFENKYEPESASVSISAKKIFEKADSFLNDNPDGITFKFKIEACDERGDPLTGDGKFSDEKSLEVKSSEDLNKAVELLSETFDEAGTYCYLISETAGDNEYIDYDETAHLVKVEITNDSSLGAYTAEIEIDGEKTDKAEVKFTNTYNPPAEASITITKGFTAAGATKDSKLTFNFNVECTSAKTKAGESIDFTDNRNVKVTVDQNAETGKSSSIEFTFTKEGTYTYTITENAGHEGTIPQGSSLENTNEPKTVKFEVKKSGNALVAHEIEGASKVSFKNTYDPPKPEIHITKSQNVEGAPVGTATVIPGDKVTYTLVVSNTGFADATDVAVSDNVQSGLVIDAESIRAAGGTITEQSVNDQAILLTIDCVPAAGSVEISFTVTVPKVSSKTVWENFATAGGDTSEKVTLTQDVGSLTVSKTVSGSAANPEDEFGFVLEIFNRDGITVNETREFTLKHGESITFNDLPAGAKYRVAEQDNGLGYTAKVGGNETNFAEGIISAETSASVAFTNVKDVFVPKGSLSIRKTVAGPESMILPDVFGFEYSLTLPAGSNLTEFNYVITNIYGNAEFDSNKTLPASGTVYLSHGQTLTFLGLPVGTGYTVKELPTAANDYIVAVANPYGNVVAENGELIATGEITADPTGAVISPTAAFTNTLKVGDLTVSKTTIGNKALSSDMFSFVVTLYADEQHTAISEDINGMYGEMYFENGVANSNISLSDGMSMTAEDIPAGLYYTVEETGYAEAGYECYLAKDWESAQNVFAAGGIIASGQIKDGETASAAFVNLHQEDEAKGKLSISKIVTGVENNDETFDFELKLYYHDSFGNPAEPATDINLVGKKSKNGVPSGNVDIRGSVTNFTLTNGENLVIEGLPENVHFVVTETDPKGHTVSVPQNTGAVAPAGAFEPFGFAQIGYNPFGIALIDNDPLATDTTSGDVKAGASVDVIFENYIEPPKKPDSINVPVTIAKKFTQDGATENNSLTFSFSVKLDGTPTRPDGTPIENAPTIPSVDVVVGQGKTGNSSKATLTFAEAGTYTYTVSEITEGKDYSGKIPEGSNLALDAAPQTVTFTVTEEVVDGKRVLVCSPATSSLEFTNTFTPKPEEPKHSYINLKKLVEDSSGDEVNGGTFTFAVTLTGLENYTGLGFVNGVREVTVEGGSSVEIEVPAGAEYVITEKDPPTGYTDISKRLTGTVAEGETKEVTYTNRKDDEQQPEPKTGSLRLSKTLTPGSPSAAGGRTFVFDIKLDVEFTGKAGDVSFVDGSAVVELKAGEEVLMTGLPSGANYTVAERAAAGYVLSVARSSGLSGTIEAEKEATAEAVNAAITPPPNIPNIPPYIPNTPTTPPDDDATVEIERPTEAKASAEEPAGAESPKTGLGFCGAVGLAGAIAAALSRKKRK